jgi:dTDP-4-dehydrorhamnose reductase
MNDMDRESDLDAMQSLDVSSAIGAGVKRIIVLGAYGRLGKTFADYFGGDHTVIPLDRENLELGSVESIERVLDSYEFDILILTAALTAVDYCESNQDEAFAVNADGPRHVAAVCKRKGAKMVYIGTDFVFDGAGEGAYRESDPVNPISVYGASKMKGEENVMAASADNLVVRIAWLYGPGAPAFPEWIIDKACSESSLTLPAEKVGCPTYAPDVAMWLAALLFGPSSEKGRGVFHLCNSEPCTWQEWGQYCVDVARDCGRPVKVDQIGASTMDSIEAFKAKRPVNSAMSTHKFQQVTEITPRSWKEALREHLEENLK